MTNKESLNNLSAADLAMTSEKYLLPPMRVVEIVECVCNYVDRISALINQVIPRCFGSYRLWLNNSNHRYQRINRY